MRISIRIRKISMRIPYIPRFSIRLTYVAACFYLTLNSALRNIVIIHMKIQHILSKMWWQLTFLLYIHVRVPLQGYDVLVANYGFDI